MDKHNSHHHTPLCIPIPDTTLFQDNLTTVYEYTTPLFHSPGNDHLTNNWNSGIDFIINNYNHGNIPHFRSTWRRFLTGNNKTHFYNTMATIIHCILHSHTLNNSAAFWWLLLHFEMLILAPTDKTSQQHSSVKSIIRTRLTEFQRGNIEHLLSQTLTNTNWNDTNPRPTERTGNKAAQLAADSDNYRTAMTRACTFNKIATINDSNMPIVNKLYPDPIPDQHHTSTHHVKIQDLSLPGDICQTIRNSKRKKGTGLLSDSINSFIELVKLNDIIINQNLQRIFMLVYQGQIPTTARHFFTDTYLFCLHKDQHDKRKLRPIGIPTAIRRIMATHVANTWKDKFALHLLPYNYAVGIPNGMDFIIKSMQLSIEKFIDTPQQQQLTPSRAAIFVDLSNMFNSVSRAELFDIIATSQN
jgi:hypothetical protein